jgi:hypothetical protein
VLEARAVVAHEVEAAVGTVRFWRGEDGLGGDGHGWRFYCEDKEVRYG